MNQSTAIETEGGFWPHSQFPFRIFCPVFAVDVLQFYSGPSPFILSNEVLVLLEAFCLLEHQFQVLHNKIKKENEFKSSAFLIEINRPSDSIPFSFNKFKTYKIKSEFLKKVKHAEQKINRT